MEKDDILKVGMFFYLPLILMSLILQNPEIIYVFLGFGLITSIAGIIYTGIKKWKN